MPDTGAPHSIPYPQASDPPAGHTQMQSLAEQVAVRLGFTGKSIIATSETRTSSSYGLLTTPDRVQSVVVPTDGIIQIRYHAQWTQSTNVTANAAIFIGSNQLQPSLQTGSSDASVAAIGNISATDHYLSSYAHGLVSDTGSVGGTNPVNPVTTGQVIDNFAGASNPNGGGACEVFIAAGTYDVSVQFKTAGGTLTVKNRKLWVRVLAF